MNPLHDIALSDWTVLRLSADDQHWDVVLGWCASTRSGRVTTPVTQFIANQSRVITSSGGRYRLTGPPGRNLAAIQIYAQTFGHIPHTCVDVTSDFLNKMLPPNTAS